MLEDYFRETDPMSIRNEIIDLSDVDENEGITYLEEVQLMETVGNFFKRCTMMKENPKAVYEQDLLEDLHNNKQYIDWLEEQPKGGEYWNWSNYYDNMLLRLPHVGDDKYIKPSGQIYTVKEINDFMFKEYNTKVKLCGDYIKIIRYNYCDAEFKYDPKTFKLTKFYDNNTSNSRTKFIDFGLTNEKFFKTTITLTFEENVTYAELKKAFDNWLRSVKRVCKDFMYLRVIEGGTKKVPKLHMHILTSLDIETDAPLFVKANVKKKNAYNLINWKHGHSLARKIHSSEYYRKLLSYNSKNLDIHYFKGRKNWTKSNKGWAKTKVFYYHDDKDQKKINTLIKNSVHIETFQYSNAASGAKYIVEIYKRDFDAVKTGKVVKDYFSDIEIKKDIDPNSVAIYISTPKANKGDVRQLEKDKIKLIEWCRSKGYPIHNIFVDFGNSGRPIDRSGYQQLLSDLKGGMFNKIVTISSNMVVTHPIDFFQLLLDLDKYNCKLEPICQDITNSSIFDGTLLDDMREQLQEEVIRMEREEVWS